MIVVDASVLAFALTDDGPQGITSRRYITTDPAIVAPEHLRVETFSVIRRRFRSRLLGSRRAEEAVEALAEMTITTVRTEQLLRRMWTLQENVSGYDAAYVAVAEAYGCTLVTGDVRLAKVVAALPVRVEVV